MRQSQIMIISFKKDLKFSNKIVNKDYLGLLKIEKDVKQYICVGVNLNLTYNFWASFL